jgi:oligopeptide transport system ATP-binding protein
MPPVLTVSDLNVRFALHQSEVTAVSDLSFALEPGETLAVVGESGSGKSQAFLSLMGLAAKNATVSGRAMLGDVDLLGLGRGDLNRYRGKDIAMIFQDPMTSLNPSLKIKDQLAEVLVRHQGYAADQAVRTSVEMLERVGIPEPVKRANAYPHELSGGMRQRVMIAMALLCRPKVLIADEPTTALDVTVQAQMLDLFKNLTSELGTALVLITHDLGVVAGIADRMMVMYGGRCVLHSTPHVARRAQRLDPIQGLPPSLEHLPQGCAFHPRCAFRFDRCFAERPPLLPSGDVREKACWYEGELKYEEVA